MPSLRLRKPHPEIFLFTGDSPNELGAPFVRIAEFYESASKLFYRRFFTLEKFKKWYSKNISENGKFTYYRDFYGYNVPGDIFIEWATIYAGRETLEEQNLITLLGPLPSRFYIIGSPADSESTIDHEYSHAFFYLYPDYKNAVESLQNGYDLSGVKRYLKANNYSSTVHIDEITSYVMFDWPLMNRAGIKTAHLRGLRDSMRQIYDYYKARYIK